MKRKIDRVLILSPQELRNAVITWLEVKKQASPKGDPGTVTFSVSESGGILSWSEEHEVDL